jgi:hypothetical protein
MTRAPNDVSERGRIRGVVEKALEVQEGAACTVGNEGIAGV